MKLIPTGAMEKKTLTEFFVSHWGSAQMVIASGVFQCDQLDGYGFLNESGEILGLVTYVIEGDKCEVISLDSLVENVGIGTRLLERVENHAKAQQCTQVRLITTNDNLHALGFYQKKGYRLTQLYPNAVERARQLKPEIPLVAANGIPITDEILLVKPL